MREAQDQLHNSLHPRPLIHSLACTIDPLQVFARRAIRSLTSLRPAYADRIVETIPAIPMVKMTDRDQ